MKNALYIFAGFDDLRIATRNRSGKSRFLSKRYGTKLSVCGRRRRITWGFCRFSQNQGNTAKVPSRKSKERKGFERQRDYNTQGERKSGILLGFSDPEDRVLRSIFGLRHSTRLRLRRLRPRSQMRRGSSGGLGYGAVGGFRRFEPKRAANVCLSEQSHHEGGSKTAL